MTFERVYGHFTLLHDKLEEQRLSGQFCDVIISVENRQFPAHKNILAASSDYFATMFSGKFEEDGKNVICLSNIKAHEFDQIIQFVYQGSFYIKPDNVCALHAAADMLCFTEIKNRCMNFILHDMREETCLRYLLYGQQFSLDFISEKALKCLCGNITGASKQPEFLKIEVDFLIQLLGRSQFVSSEQQIVELIVKWMENNPEVSEEKANLLLDQIRYGLLGSSGLHVLLKNNNVLGTQKVNKIISNKANCDSNHLTQALVGNMYTPRQSSDFIVLGGTDWWNDNPASLSDDMTASRISMGDTRLCFTKLSAIPEPAMCLRNVVCNNFLFTFGGITSTQPPVLTDKVHRYNSLNNSWMQMKSMKKPKMLMAITSNEQNGTIFSIGGQCSLTGRNKTPCADVEKYDIATNEWVQLNNFPHELVEGLACCIKSKLYVVFVTSREERRAMLHHVDVYEYKPTEDAWSLVGSTPQSPDLTYLGNLFPMNGQLFIAEYVKHEKLYFRQVEMFNPETAQTTHVQDLFMLNGPCSTSTVHGNTLFAVGGVLGLHNDSLSLTDKYYYYEYNAYKYYYYEYDSDIGKWKVKTCGDWPNKIIGCTVAALSLPK